MRSMYCLFRNVAVASLLIGLSLPLHAQLVGDSRSEVTVADNEGNISQDFLSDSAEDMAAISNATVISQIPEQLRDTAFDRYVDLLLLGEAWERLDPALMTDIALQLAEGERVLFRSHKAFKSQDMFRVAAKMAVDRRDQATLDRLQKHFEQSGDKSMSESLAASHKLAGATRAVEPGLLISVEETNPETYALYRGLVGEAKAASYVGNRETLDALDSQIHVLAGLTDQQKKYLQSIIGQTRGAAEEVETPELANHLDILMDASRGWGPPKISPPKLRVPITELPKTGNKPGPFQQKVAAGAAAGAATGATFGSWAGPAGSGAGAAGGAVAGAAGTVVDNHAKKRWTGGGLDNWRNPRRW